MSDLDRNVASLKDKILTAPRKGKRRIVAIAGPPGSGKSTLAARLAETLDAAGCATQVVPMDGFHLDNSILKARGFLHRKGAPETFDIHGLLSLVSRLPNDNDIVFPIFDRTRDIAIAGAEAIESNCDTILVEGNYLLLNMPIWQNLSEIWDFSIAINTPEPILRQRLIKRWLSHGLSLADAENRTDENDLPNAHLFAEMSLTADVYV